MRRRAKAVNFGVLYGMSEMRLAREQGVSRADARRFIQAYFERFGKVREYIDEVRDRARSDGEVRTLFGRVRLFPQLQQRVNRAVQEQALRAAVNTTIQGTAADLMKLAMLAVDRELARRQLGARILLQVHDELLLEVPVALVKPVGDVVREAMEGVSPMVVPLVVDQKTGANWLEAT
jgi:DNA polymerase-1